TRGDAEQVGVGERVPEDALVRRAGDREHAADERGDDDARRAQLPEDRVLHAAERRVHVQQRHVRERRDDDGAGRDADGADAEPDEQRGAEERERDRRPGGSHAACAHSRPDGLGDHDFFATCAIARANCTMRGPQREATLSSTVITRWLRTAATPLQPGRAATFAAVCPQPTESASTTMSGFAETMYSAESCG